MLAGWASVSERREAEVDDRAVSAGRLPGLISSRGVTLLELLVVIAIVALLLAIFIPVGRAARERGQRAVCLNNLKQLTLAWIAYADEHDGKLVCGSAYYTKVALLPSDRRTGRHTQGWLGKAFFFPESRSALIANPDKGALWPFVRDIDIYRCPRGHPADAATYVPVAAANGVEVEGTYRFESVVNSLELRAFGKRVGGTVLYLSRLTDITSPGPAARAVFLDGNTTPGGGDFYVHYLYGQWAARLAPPIHHGGGMTLSMADGHAEHWKWRGSETLTGLPRKLFTHSSGGVREYMDKDYRPQTEDGLYDLQRLQRATWGRLGYSQASGPEGNSGP
jgi:prepilin-type N-terminal cleavage/methylation domain-containing protein/prepilin-type processing-associated H-X9-DG protein